MKIIYIILLFISANASATVYYIDNNGNDASDGTTMKTPWRTIAKVNSSIFIPGDKILFKKGNVWNERLIPPSSGSIGRVITFGSYGKGAKPLITGLQKQSGFTNVGNIWTATATNSVLNQNTVLIAGSIRAKARYPNTGYLKFTSYNAINQITGSLTGSPDYKGAEVVVRSSHWTIDICKITSQVAGTINFSPALSYVPILGGDGYFIQNTPLALDTFGEWSYNSGSKMLKVYATSYPAVQISTIDTLTYVNNKEFITIDGLSFQGANQTAIQLQTTNNITIQNCSVNYSGRWAIAGIFSSHISIINDSIQNSLSNGIVFNTSDFTKPGCDYVLIDNNFLKNTGTMAGMAFEHGANYFGIAVLGVQPRITNNRIDSTGYTAISFGGPKSLIKNNYITNFCFVKDDGGGIYTVIGKDYPINYSAASLIRSNIVINGIGAPAGTSDGSKPSAGIYLDRNTKQIVIDSNTVSNCNTAAICFSEANDITLKENTVVNGIGSGILIYGSNNNVTNLSIKKNIIFSKRATENNLSRVAGTSMGNIDSNYYSRLSDSNTFNLNAKMYKISEWNSQTTQDLHSVSKPVNETKTSPLFYYNPTGKDSTILLSGTYLDSKGRKYKSSITLQPFCSTLLFKNL